MDNDLVPDSNQNLTPKKSQKSNLVENDWKSTRPIVIMTKLPDLDVTQDLVLSPTIIVNDPTAELLGSVTTFTPKQGPESGQTVRTSARVIQKLKQDSIRPPTPPPPEKKDHNGKDERNGPKTPNQPKPNRSMWSNTEKNYFFEALNEYGKDFESIALYINTRAKRISLPNVQIKSREQVRLFYYQSYQKVSKYLKFSDDVKKLAQELYALINYGEMRKKLTFVNEKYFLKLRDLVYKGLVTIRTKGKNVKIKTPSCKALRQLNQLEEWQEDIKLPTRVEILFKPINIETWGKVQNLAQNPRVKMTLPIQRRVSNVIKTLQFKWRLQENRLCDRTMAMHSAPTKKSNKSVPVEEPSPPQYVQPKIRLLPPPEATIHRPMVSLGTFLSSRRICLNSYEERIGVKIRGETLCSERISYLKEMMKANAKRQRHDSSSDKKSPDLKKSKLDMEIRPLETNDKNGKVPNKTENVTELSVKSETDIVKKEQDLNVNESQTTPSSTVSVTTVSTTTTTSTTVTVTAPKTSSTSKTAKRKETKSTARQKKENYRPLISPETMRKIREGWTLENAGDITVGDLYIMFGNDLRLCLEYQFVQIKQPKLEISSSIEIRTSISTTNLTLNGCGSTLTGETIKSEKKENDDRAVNVLGSKLKQLLTVASMMEQKKSFASCVCGHVCDNKLLAGRLFKDDTSSFISNKTHLASQLDSSLFRSPTMPARNNCIPVIDQYKHNVNSMRIKQQRWMKFRNRPMFNNKPNIQRIILPPSLSPPPRTTIAKPIPRPQKSTQSSESPKIEIKIVEKNNSKSGCISTPYQNKHNTTVTATVTSTMTTSSTQSISSTKTKSDIDSLENSNKFKSIWTDLNDSKMTPNISTTVQQINSNGDYHETTLNDDFLNLPDLDSQSSFIRNLNENSGLKCLMEISLPSPIHFECGDDSKIEVVPSSTPPMSPMKMIKEYIEAPDEPEWLSPDHMNDFSFSSFLGHLDNLATTTTDNATKKNVCASQNTMDCTNLSVISESTVDYMTKFEQITAELKSQDISGGNIDF